MNHLQPLAPETNSENNMLESQKCIPHYLLEKLMENLIKKPNLHPKEKLPIVGVEL